MFFVAIVGTIVGTIFYYSSAKHRPIIEYSSDKEKIVIMDDEIEDNKPESKPEPERKTTKENVIANIPALDPVLTPDPIIIPPAPLYYQIPAVQNQAVVVRHRSGGGPPIS